MLRFHGFRFGSRSINLKRCRSSKPVLFGYLDSPNSSFTSSAALPSVPSLPQL